MGLATYIVYVAIIFSLGVAFGALVVQRSEPENAIVRRDLTAGLVHVTGLEPLLPIAQKGSEVELRIKFNDDDKLFLTFDRYTCNVIVSPENARSLALTLNRYADEMLKSDSTIEDFLRGFPDDDLDNLFPVDED